MSKIDWDELQDRIDSAIDYEQFYDNFLDHDPNPAISNGWKNYYCVFHDDDPSGRPNLHCSIENGGFNCKKCNEKGSIWDFLEKHPSISKQKGEKAIWLAEYLGIDIPKEHTPNIPYKESALENLEADYKAASAVLGCSEDVVRKFDIRHIIVEDEFYWVWPMMDSSGIHAYKLMTQDMSKKFFSDDSKIEGSKNLDIIYPGHLLEEPKKDRLWICEGEKDCIRLFDKGELAASPTNGVNSSQKEIARYVEGHSFDEIIIAFDQQAPLEDGSVPVEEAAGQIREMLGKEENVKHVVWPDSREDGWDVSDEINDYGFESLVDLIKDFPLERAAEHSPNGWEEIPGNRIVEKNGVLHSKRGGDDPHRIAEFTVKPIKNLINTESSESDILQVLLVGKNGQKERVSIPFEDLQSKREFQGHLKRSWMHWYGSDKEVKELAVHLQRKGIQKRALTRYGLWPDKGVIAIPQGVIDKDGLRQDTEYESVETDTRWDDAFYEPKEPDEHIIETVGEHLYDAHSPDFLYPALTFFAASWFRAWFWKNDIPFHYLYIYGTSGAGKSHFTDHIIAKMFGVKSWRLVDASATPFYLIRHMAKCCGPPLVVDEMKEDLDQRRIDWWKSKLRRLYDGFVDGRGNPDQTTTAYHLISPVTIIGEMSILSDKSEHDRAIEVHVDGQWLNTDKGQRSRKAYDEISPLPTYQIGYEYMKFVAKTAEEGEIGTYWSRADNSIDQMKGTLDRVARGHKIAAFGAMVWKSFCEEIGMACPDDIVETTIEIAKEKHQEAFIDALNRQTNELDQYIEDLSTMAASGDLEFNKQFSGSCGDDDLLYLHNNSCHQKWRTWIKDISNERVQMPKHRVRDLLDQEDDRKEGYVVDTKKTKRWSSDRTVRSDVLNLDRLKKAGIDVRGFYHYLEDENIMTNESEPVADDDAGDIPF